MTSYQENARKEGDRASGASWTVSSWLEEVIQFDFQGLREGWRAFCGWWKQYGIRCIVALAVIAGTGLSGYFATVPDSPSTPGGMLALELPGTRSSVLSMLALLKEANGGVGTWYVTRALMADFVFVLFYVGVLGVVLRWGVRRRFGATGKDGTGLRWIDSFALCTPLVAGVFDYVENLCLLMLIHGTAGADGSHAWAGLLASLTTVASLCKWTLLTFIAVYFTRLLVLLWWRWVMKKKQERRTVRD